MHKHRKQSDGNMRDSDNWQKGIPRDQYIKSLFRHFMELWSMHRNCVDGDIEEALCAIMFNTQGYLFELLRQEDQSCSWATLPDGSVVDLKVELRDR
jgi:hypothetical protein